MLFLPLYVQHGGDTEAEGLFSFLMLRSETSSLPQDVMLAPGFTVQPHLNFCHI